MSSRQSSASRRSWQWPRQDVRRTMLEPGSVQHASERTHHWHDPNKTVPLSLFHFRSLTNHFRASVLWTALVSNDIWVKTLMLLEHSKCRKSTSSYHDQYCRSMVTISERSEDNRSMRAGTNGPFVHRHEFLPNAWESQVYWHYTMPSF